MFIPGLLARVEQSYFLASQRISSFRAIIFGIIASGAGQPEVIFVGCPLLRSWYQMVNF
jgi:hypothetical protein